MDICALPLYILIFPVASTVLPRHKTSGRDEKAERYLPQMTTVKRERLG